MRCTLLSLIAPALILALPTSSPAQQSLQSPSVTTLKVYSREVIVDIIVSDAKGLPIRNLAKSQFSIEEDGKPQPVRSFSEFGAEVPGLGGAQPALPPQVHTNFQSAPTSGPVNIVLIDALHLNFVAADRALQAVSAYAMHMPAGAEVAVFWLGASGLHMLQTFTIDAAAIQQAVSVTRTDIGSNQDCYATDRLTIQALNQIATYAAAIKGRKNLIWIAPGAPVYLLRDGGYAWGTTTACHNYDTQSAFANSSRDASENPLGFGASRDGGYSLFTGPDGQTTHESRRQPHDQPAIRIRRLRPQRQAARQP
jgi:VWFA-related protein